MIKMDYQTQNIEYDNAIKKLFHGETWNEREEAARILGKLKDARAINLLARALKSEKDEVVINRIIETLGKIRNPKATMLLTNFLKKEIELPEQNQNKERLFIIIESLMKIGDKRALEHLGLLLNSCYDDIRSLTEQAFNCIDPNWKKNLKESE